MLKREREVTNHNYFIFIDRSLNTLLDMFSVCLATLYYSALLLPPGTSQTITLQYWVSTTVWHGVRTPLSLLTGRMSRGTTAGPQFMMQVTWAMPGVWLFKVSGICSYSNSILGAGYLYLNKVILKLILKVNYTTYKIMNYLWSRWSMYCQKEGCRYW